MKKKIIFASLKSLKKGGGSGSAPKCQRSPTLPPRKSISIIIYCTDSRTVQEDIAVCHPWYSFLMVLIWVLLAEFLAPNGGKCPVLF
jgi:hypothetical protein